MATINDPKIVRKILGNRGIYADDSGEDPACLLIASYLNDYGKTAYSLCYTPSSIASLYASPYCRNILALFEDGAVTEHGQAFLKSDAGADTLSPIQEKSK